MFYISFSKIPKIDNNYLNFYEIEPTDNTSVFYVFNLNSSEIQNEIDSQNTREISYIINENMLFSNFANNIILKTYFVPYFEIVDIYDYNAEYNIIKAKFKFLFNDKIMYFLENESFNDVKKIVVLNNTNTNTLPIYIKDAQKYDYLYFPEIDSTGYLLAYITKENASYYAIGYEIFQISNKELNILYYAQNLVDNCIKCRVYIKSIDSFFTLSENNNEKQLDFNECVFHIQNITAINTLDEAVNVLFKIPNRALNNRIKNHIAFLGNTVDCILIFKNKQLKAKITLNQATDDYQITISKTEFQRFNIMAFSKKDFSNTIVLLPLKLQQVDFLINTSLLNAINNNFLKQYVISVEAI